MWILEPLKNQSESWKKSWKFVSEKGNLFLKKGMNLEDNMSIAFTMHSTASQWYTAWHSMTSASVWDPLLLCLCVAKQCLLFENRSWEVAQSLDSAQNVTQWFNLCCSILKGRVEHMAITEDIDTEWGALFHSWLTSLVYLDHLY